MREAPPVAVRDAREEDLDAAADVMVEAYAEYMPEVLEGVWLDYRDEIHDVRSRLSFTDLIVAEWGGEIQGAVTFYPDGRADAHADWPRGSSVFRLLAVAPAARGRGVGRTLTEECLRRSRALGSTEVGLHTTDLMAVARAMYERMGFVRAPHLDFWPLPDLQVYAYRLPL